MKKLKLFLLMFAAAIASAGFTACSDDDDEAAASIVGSWIRQTPEYVDIFTFTAEGTFTEQYQDLKFEDSETLSGTYTYDGQFLIMSEEGEEEQTVVLAAVSDDTLILGGSDVFVRM